MERHYCSTRLSNNAKAVQELKTWGMELDPDLVPITGRRLDPEMVILGNRNKPYQCDAQADWTTSMLFTMSLNDFEWQLSLVLQRYMIAPLVDYSGHSPS